MVTNEPIVFKSEDSMWQMLAERGLTGIPTKPYDVRHWDLADNRIYRLSFGHMGEGNFLWPMSSGIRWSPQEPYVSFYNKATEEIISFEYRGVEFVPWAPGWGFILLGNWVELNPAYFEEYRRRLAEQS
ncbi:MAG TPA: hypothetical protein VJM51_05200 [Dehalococcoidia bacterium]|nr:hypothetical protein [Dehalococcoidia bacterium]